MQILVLDDYWNLTRIKLYLKFRNLSSKWKSNFFLFYFLVLKEKSVNRSHNIQKGKSKNMRNLIDTLEFWNNQTSTFSLLQLTMQKKCICSYKFESQIGTNSDIVGR